MVLRREVSVARDDGGWLCLSAPPRVVFDRTPLALAICQVRFPAMLNVSNPGTVAPFQAAIQDEYPVATSMAQLGMSFRLEGGQVAGVQSQPPSALWRFADIGDDWAVVLSPDFVGLETRAYVSFGDFRARLRRVLDALSETVRPRVCTRVGLRYINELRPGHREWAAVVRPELLGPMVVPPLAECAVRWAQQILLRGPDGDQVHVQHGVIPGGTTVEPRPGDDPPDEGPFYLLDLDAYREFARPALPAFSSGDVCDRVLSAHGTISEFFRWAIAESYATTLGVRDDAGD